MINLADEETLWFSLDEDDDTYEQPVAGIATLFWAPDRGESLVGYVDDNGEVHLFNLDADSDVEVTHWADLDLEELAEEVDE